MNEETVRGPLEHTVGRKATPHTVLINELLDSNTPKTEREHAAAREIAMLRQEVEYYDELREKMADILNRTALALRGPEPPLHKWGWHDLPERAAAAVAASKTPNA